MDKNDQKTVYLVIEDPESDTFLICRAPVPHDTIGRVFLRLAPNRRSDGNKWHDQSCNVAHLLVAVLSAQERGVDVHRLLTDATPQKDSEKEKHTSTHATGIIDSSPDDTFFMQLLASPLTYRLAERAHRATMCLPPLIEETRVFEKAWNDERDALLTLIKQPFKTCVSFLINDYGLSENDAETLWRAYNE